MDVEDDDPVVAEYDVFITPETEAQQLYVLQYLNRPPDQPFTKATESQPTALRIKKDSGFVEVDVPIDIHHNYNRPAGVRWGESMRKTKGFGQRAFGIASGFERTMPRNTNRPGAGEGAPAAPTAVDDDDNFEEYVTHFEDANEKGHVLNAQTFGGQILKDDGKGPSYMLGTFRDGRVMHEQGKLWTDKMQTSSISRVSTASFSSAHNSTTSTHLPSLKQWFVVAKKSRKKAQSQRSRKPSSPRLRKQAGIPQLN
jgi:hypothetical protein